MCSRSASFDPSQEPNVENKLELSIQEGSGIYMVIFWVTLCFLCLYYYAELAATMGHS